MIRTEQLPTIEAAFIQEHDKDYNCHLMSVGVMRNEMARVIVEGEEENLEKLFGDAKTENQSQDIA